jgi:hypothetical protein
MKAGIADARCMKPLARVASELLAFGVVWSLAGVACVGIALAIDDLDATQLAAVAGLLALTLVGVFSGRRIAFRQGRTQPLSRLLPEAPGVARESMEPRVKTWLRGMLVAFTVVPLTALVWTIGLALILTVGDEPISLSALLGSAALATGAWMLLGAGATFLMARSFLSWERNQGGVILVHPLHSGQLKPVYFHAPPPPSR